MIVSAVLLVLASGTDAAATAAAPIDPLDKIRCVRQTVTGSLARVEKVCHTEREWRRIRGDAEEEARRMTYPGNPTPSN